MLTQLAGTLDSVTCAIDCCRSRYAFRLHVACAAFETERHPLFYGQVRALRDFDAVNRLGLWFRVLWRYRTFR